MSAPCPYCGNAFTLTDGTLTSAGCVDWHAEPHSLPAPCRDCGVATGGMHHIGCCVAQCARCDDQAIFCDHNNWPMLDSGYVPEGVQ